MILNQNMLEINPDRILKPYIKIQNLRVVEGMSFFGYWMEEHTEIYTNSVRLKT